MPKEKLTLQYYCLVLETGTSLDLECLVRKVGKEVASVIGGRFSGGNGGNIISETVMLSLSFRCTGVFGLNRALLTSLLRVEVNLEP
jgi:hypothetical protein